MKRKRIGVLKEHDLGMKTADLCRKYGISEATVSHHLTSIFDKLGLANRFDLVVYAYRHGLAKPDEPSAS